MIMINLLDEIYSVNKQFKVLIDVTESYITNVIQSSQICSIMTHNKTYCCKMLTKKG